MALREGETAGSPQVTVLIAALNAGAFITRAIDSALEQSGVELEVLVVDDGSTDDTADVATRRGDPRLRVVSLRRNLGPSAARNVGLQDARGEWVAILDADDAYEPGRLKRLLATGQAEAADIVSDNFRFYDTGSRQAGEPALTSNPPLEQLSASRFVDRARPYLTEADYGLLKPVFRRDFLIQNRLLYSEEMRHGEDFFLIFQALQAGGRYCLVRTPGYLYSTRQSGQSRTKVDYDSQVALARALASAALARGDRELASALTRRARALAKLSASHRIERAWAARDPVALLAVAMQSSHAIGALARRMILAASR